MKIGIKLKLNISINERISWLKKNIERYNFCLRLMNKDNFNITI